MASRLTRFVSGLDFWDKEENKRQREQYAREEEEEKRRKQQVRVQQQQSTPRQQQQFSFQPTQNQAPDNSVTLNQGSASNFSFQQNQNPGQRLNQTKQPDKIVADQPRQSAWDRVKRVAQIGGTSVARVGTGIAQGAAGTYDLLTPGKGTNRVSQALDRQAKELDSLAEERGYGSAYRGANIAGEIGSYLLPGKLISKAPTIFRAVDRGARALGTAVSKAAGGGKGARFVGNTVREFARPTSIATELAIGSKQTGEEASKGEDVSPGEVAANLGLGVAGAGVEVLGRGLRQLWRARSGSAVRAGEDVIDRGASMGAAGAASQLIPGSPARKVNVFGEPSKLPTQSGNVLEPVAGEAAPGIQSANTNRFNDAMSQMADLETPAYTRREPQTVGQAQAQQALGVNNIPDSTFDADARVIANNDVPNPLDVPTFLRNNAESNRNDAITRLNQLEDLIAGSEAGAGRSAEFARRQELANLFRSDPNAAARQVAFDRARPRLELDRQQALVRLLGQKRAAQSALRAADEALDARNSLNGVVTDELPPAPIAATSIPSPAAALPEPLSAVDSGVPTTPAVAQAAEQTPIPRSNPNRELPKGERERFSDKARPISEDTGHIIDRADAGDIDGARSGIDRLIEDPEFTAKTERGAAIRERVQKLKAYVDKKAAEAPRVPEIPSGGAEVPVAPRTHDALVDSLGPSQADAKGQYSTREQINLEELKNRAEAAIADMSDEDLIRSFQTKDAETLVTDSNSLAVARAALQRIARSDDPSADQMVKTILDAMEQYTSKSAQALRIIQEEFDNLPLPAKVRYIIKKIDAANAKDPNYSPLREDPARAARIEDEITLHLQRSQKISERAAALENQVNQVAEAALRGERASVDVPKLVKSLQDERKALAESNGELVKFYETLLPKRSKGQRSNDFARRMMLANFTGRLNDVLTTSSNVASLGVQNAIQGVIAKGVNAIRPGTVTDTFRGGRAFLKGTREGLKRSGGEFAGRRYSGDLQKSLSGDELDTRSNLKRVTGPVGRTIQAATELATHASAGVRNQRVYQLAIQEGQKQGLKGRLLTQYADARAAVPTRLMRDKADQLHMEMNNLNDNPVSTALNRVGKAIEGNSWLGGLVKNQIMPFTSWLGGNIYNTITDKNVVASAIKVVANLRKGDPEALTQALAKLGNNAAQTYALGYLLSQSGFITNEDAEGFNDAGAYIHIGDRYIPAGFLGFMAPNIILGNAAYNALNDEEAGSVAEKIGTFASDAIANLARSVNLTSALGTETNAARALNTALRNGGNAIDGVTEFLGGAVGQFIPAITGDVNSILNNYTPLNPTRENAQTRAENEDGSKNYLQTSVNRLLNRLPVVSQLALSRKEGVAADDPIDRTTRGNRDTETSKAEKADKQSKVDRQARNKELGIPDYEEENFDTKVKAREELGDWDIAEKALQQKLDNIKDDPETPESDKKKLQDRIRRLQVNAAGKYTPELVALYDKTSNSDWKKYEDPESEYYDPELYQQLWEYDQALTKEKVSDNSQDSSKSKYSVSDSSGKGKGKGGGKSSVTSNTVSSPQDIGKISFGNLTPRQIGGAQIPSIARIKPSQLVKRRTITTRKGA